MKQLIKSKYGKNMWIDVPKNTAIEVANMGYEKAFLDFIETNKCDIFIDIGAAWGYFSIPASFNSSIVLAYEPLENRRELLIKNIESHGCKNIVIHPYAIGTGKLKLFVANMIGPKYKKRVTPIEVKWIDLESVINSYDKDKTFIVKMDVEGAELDVIESAGDLSQYAGRVSWLIERHQDKDYGYSEEELFKKMYPFIGRNMGTRRISTHYIFDNVAEDGAIGGGG